MAPAPPTLHPSLAQVYAGRVAVLREALDASDGEAAFETWRALIETVVAPPPDDPDDRPRIEPTGNLMAMLDGSTEREARAGVPFFPRRHALRARIPSTTACTSKASRSVAR